VPGEGDDAILVMTARVMREMVVIARIRRFIS